MPYSIRFDFFDGSSGQSTDYTSDDYCTADLRQVVLSVHTDDTGASRFTVQGSNDDGFTSAISYRSDLTAITLAGSYTIDPGMRWLRVLRSSLESLSVVQLGGRT